MLGPDSLALQIRKTYSLTQAQRIRRAKIIRTNFCETGP